MLWRWMNLSNNDKDELDLENMSDKELIEHNICPDCHSQLVNHGGCTECPNGCLFLCG